MIGHPDMWPGAWFGIATFFAAMILIVGIFLPFDKTDFWRGAAFAWGTGIIIISVLAVCLFISMKAWPDS